MAETPIKIAMIGTGMVAKTHLLAIRDATPAMRLIGVCARHRASASRFAEEAGKILGTAPDIYTDAAEIAADPEIDLVIVLTPPNARIDVVKTLAHAGKPILMEKPVARDGTEAALIVKLCETADVPLGIVFQHRMREASRKAASLVASGALGPLGLVEITVPWWRDQSYYDEPGRGTYARDGGGVLISQAIHTIDLALSLTGPVTAVQAMTATTRFHKMEAEDFATAGLRFVCGAVGTLTASTASYPGAAETITLHYENASLRLGEGLLRLDWSDGRTEEHGASAATGGGADPMAFTHDWHQGILEDFVTALRNGRAPLVTGREALKSHRLIDAITASARAGTKMEVVQ